MAGLSSTGIGEVNDFILLNKCKMKGALAAGTSVFVVFFTVLVGSVFHAFSFFTNNADKLPIVAGIVLFAIPGVILGAQIGVKVSQLISDNFRKKFISFVFVVISIATIFSLI